MGWYPRKTWPGLPTWAKQLSFEEKLEIYREIWKANDKRKRSLELKKLYTGENYPIQKQSSHENTVTAYIDLDSKNLIIDKVGKWPTRGEQR